MKDKQMRGREWACLGDVLRFVSIAEWFNPSSSFLLLFCPGQWKDIWRLHCKSRTPAPAPIRLISLSLPFTSYPPLRCLSSHLPRSHASTLSTSPPPLHLTCLSSLIFCTPRFAHFQSSRIFFIASLGFHVIQSIPAILQVLCMLPDCSSEIYHVTSIQRQIPDREINANREICYLSLRFRKNLCTVFWNFERLFPSPSGSPSRLLLRLNLSFPLFPSITHHFLLLFSSHSFCFFLLFLILSSSLGQWEFRKLSVSLKFEKCNFTSPATWRKPQEHTRTRARVRAHTHIIFTVSILVYTR